MTYDSIWDDPENWPSRDPAGYVFLARAVSAVGKAVFGDEWTGDEAPAPRPYMSQGCLVIDVLSESEKQGTARFDKVQDTIATAAETGTLVTAAREVGGGRMIPISAADWSTEHLARRFATCRLDPSDPFGHFGNFLTHWIYVDAESLERLIRGRKETGGPAPTHNGPGVAEDEHQPATTSNAHTRPSERTKRRGRPSKLTPECEHAARQIVANMKASQAQFGKTDTAVINAFQKWYERKHPSETPPVRSTVEGWFTKWGL